MWQLIGTITSILGLLSAMAFGVYQHRVAVRAESKADQERSRRASLEDHLERQRWQQLKSMGEQIDAIESDGKKEYEPRLAGLYASLREQYSSLLSVVATSEEALNPSVVRSWVTSGRLKRPWQIAEAISHLNQKNMTSGDDEDRDWLSELINKESIVPKPRSVQKPKEPTPYVAAYILIANAVSDELQPALRKGGQHGYSLTVLLNHLAEDCVALRNKGAGRDPTLKAWGHEQGKSFGERVEHYNQQEFWVMVNAADTVAGKLKGFERYFDHTGDLVCEVVPTGAAVEELRSLYPDIAEQSRTVLTNRS